MKLRFNANSLVAALALALAAPAAFAQATYSWSGGSTNITDGTALATNWVNLTGTWDTTTKNFTTDNGTTYIAWSNGGAFSAFVAGFATNAVEYATITNAENLSVSSISVALSRASQSISAKYLNLVGTNKTLELLAGTVIDVRGASPVLAQEGGALTYGLIMNSSASSLSAQGGNLALTGSSGFTKTGNYGFYIRGNSDALTGTVNILHNANLDGANSAGVVTVQSNFGGSLAGITRFNISATDMSGNDAAAGTTNGYGNLTKFFVVRNATNANQLNDSAMVNLAGSGIFQYTGLSNTETIGTLRLASAGILDVSGNGNGGTLSITNGIQRATTNAQLIVAITAGATNGTAVNLGTSHGLGTNTLIPWMVDGTKARFGLVDAGNNVGWVTPTSVTGDVSTITDINANYRIEGQATSFTVTNLPSGAAANTLAFYRGTSSGTGAIINVTDSLIIGSGGIVTANDGSIITATIDGTNGTYLTTSNNAPLYLATGANSATGALEIKTSITGNIDVIKAGPNGAKFGGTNQANTFTGTLYVNGGSMLLGKSSGVNALAGNAVVRSGGILDLDQSHQIADTATVTIENGGFFKTDSYSETISNLAGGGMLLSETASSANTFTVKGYVAPGDGGIGTMINNRVGTSSVFKMDTNAVFNIELAGNGATFDRMDFYNFTVGEFSLTNNAINLALLGTKTPGTYTNSIFRFYSDNGTTFTNSTISSGLAIGTWSTNDFASTPTISYNGTSIDLTYEVVPEPSTYALLGLSGLALAAYRLRRRNR